MIITCIEDQKQQFKKKVPKMFSDFVDTGSWTESTYHANEKKLQEIKFRQRVGINIEGRTTLSTMLGQDVTMPVALSPIGMLGMIHGDGEILAANAAKEFGVPFCLSTMSMCSIEEVSFRTQKPFWFQLYVMRDRKFTSNLISRARHAGCSALVLTLDLQILGQRHRDKKNGISAPPRLTVKNMLNFTTHPSWCWSILNTSNRKFGNIVGHVKGVRNAADVYAWANTQYDPTLTWDDVKWIRKQWDGKLILKGIMDPEDAILAKTIGADVIVVSNHGGRQLDGAPSTIEVLPEVVDAVGSSTDVWLDSGIRSGQDVLRALALGAKGTMIGRPYVYGLGAQGYTGVMKSLGIIQQELVQTMGFCGLQSIDDVSKNIIYKGSLYESC